MTQITARRLALMIAVLLLGAAVRIVHIADQSFWIDEGFTYHIALKAPDIAAELARIDLHPPLYFALLRAWAAVAGDSELALRLLSTFFGLLSVAAVFRLALALDRARGWPHRHAAAIVAALLLALFDPEIVQAQEARMYTLRTLLTILSFLFYINWMRQPSTRAALPWMIANLALIYTQYQGVFVPAVQGLHALICLRGRVRAGAIGALAVPGVLFLPWLIGVVLDQRFNDQGINAGLPSNWATVVELTHKFLGQHWPLMLGLLLLGTVSLRYEAARVRVLWRPWAGTLLLALWIGVTVGATFAANLLFPVLSPRRIVLISPAMAILTARGILNFRPPAPLFLVTVIVIYSLATVDDYYPKPPWREVGAGVAQYAVPSDLHLLEIYRADFALGYYLDRFLPPDATIRSLRTWREDSPATYEPEVMAALESHDSVWLTHWSVDRGIFELLARAGHIQTAQISVDHWGNLIHSYRFDRPPDSALARFENGMMLRAAAAQPDAGRIDLWWSAEAALPHDYTVAAIALDAGGAVALQHDSFPFEGRRPTTDWAPGELIYDPHPLALHDLPPGRYQLIVLIYTWFDGVRVLTETGAEWFEIDIFERP